VALGGNHLGHLGCRVAFLDDADGGLVVGVGVALGEGVDGGGVGFVEGDSGAEGDETGEEEGGEDGFHGAGFRLGLRVVVGLEREEFVWV
jgi:hypothetical protein